MPTSKYIGSSNNILDNALSSFMFSQKAIGKLSRDRESNISY